MEARVTAALADCRRVLDRSGSTFSLAFRLLPRDQRDAMTAFYAFCREVDDAVDEAPDAASARVAIEEWRGRVAAIHGGARVHGGAPVHPVVAALAWGAARFGIRREHLDLVLDGVEADLRRDRYATFADLYDYCYRVASSVGLVCVTVLGDRSPEAFRYAELAGIGVQMTNVIRDVGEDAGRGRVYLPAEDMEAFGVAESDVLGRRYTPALQRLLRFEARRARAFHEMAAGALPPRSRGRLFFAEALRETYLALLDRIEVDGFPVLDRKVSLPAAARVRIALRRRLDPASWLGGAA